MPKFIWKNKMKILISTTNRHVPVDQPTGYLFVYDFDKKKVIRQCSIVEPPYLKENPNPRGGLRGLKGISIRDDHIALVNSSTVFLYDSKWRPIRYFFHPSCSSIHELVLSEKEIWVTSASNDLLFCFDYMGKLLNYYDVRKFDPLINQCNWKSESIISEEQVLSGAIDFRDPRTHDMVETDHAHVNSVMQLPNGDLFVSCGLLKNSGFSLLLSIKYWLLKRGVWQHLLKINLFMRKTLFKKKNESGGEMIFQPAKGCSAVILINKTGLVKKCLSVNGTTVPSHSARFLQDGTAIYLNSSKGEIIHFNPDNGEIHFSMCIGDKFLRGARELPDGTLLLGDNNYILHFDVNQRKVLSKLLLTEQTSSAIFDFCVLPDHFELPPISFQEHHDRLLPVIQ